MTGVRFYYEDSKSINMTVCITNYKHSDLKTKTISIRGSSVNAMLNHFKISKHKSGPLFQFPCGTLVSYFYFNSSLKSLLSFIGLNPALCKAHSFRIGAATSAAIRRVPLSVIQSMGRWTFETVDIILGWITCNITTEVHMACSAVYITIWGFTQIESF